MIQRGARVLLGVDATNIKKDLLYRHYAFNDDNPFRDNVKMDRIKFDKIIFNFPHHFESDALRASHEKDKNAQLLRKFLRSALEVLKPEGRIYVTLHIDVYGDFEVNQYETWNVDSIVRELDLLK